MIPSFVKTHIFYIAILALLFAFGHYWLAEHDARMAAEATIKTAQSQIVTLQGQIVQEQATAAATVRAIQAKVVLVKTPAQAIAAIPDVSSLPLNTRPAPDGGVTVDAVPLFQELAQCKEDAVQLASCTQVGAQKDQIIAQQGTEIKALKAKPKFWQRVKGDAKKIALGIGIGLVVAHGF